MAVSSRCTARALGPTRAASTEPMAHETAEPGGRGLEEAANLLIARGADEERAVERDVEDDALLGDAVHRRADVAQELLDGVVVGQDLAPKMRDSAIARGGGERHGE